MRPMTRTTILAVLVAAGAAVLVACATHRSMAQKHPVAVADMPICSDCHTDGRSALDHRADFITRHRVLAGQNRQSCDVCHAPSFCADCHANKEELMPSEKFKDEPARSSPHRGDWLNQHKIDGKINPASCFPCHGRQDNAQCRVCHR